VAVSRGLGPDNGNKSPTSGDKPAVYYRLDVSLVIRMHNRKKPF